ncbi:UDP-3-O-(3-hydroxymyristoyl)glucosamine N-acyltransferase [Marinomonas sp. IMCC 4694]|uniref:UDP-3-O-(3-hydroxymyristoyl)glucosamine N-acyltransferase n=1 Tax=Marinomonas sp. IMCC 4694 TaxID=2605432 RepID=UPI0011E88DD8|nr:UDP-3-O-(3-hydroxymyristoyl)glucosamine N-acyltransferase [Marinomonas sp. IMCC 4694]TYL47244.1 UDP-3-O-(3-hydroxymyristoyl)glucosamine N-acyltransferase [Marinomonas sp. IMCC 4694]
MSHTLGQLADRVQGEVKGRADLVIKRLGTLENATHEELSFLANPKYEQQLFSTSAGAVLVKTHALAQLVDNAIIVANPYLAFAHLSRLYEPVTQCWTGIHHSAVISHTAVLADNVIIGPNVVIDEDVVIDEGTVIGAGCVLGRGVKIGKRTRLYPNVTLYHDVIIGSDCIIHSQVVIGADGFGFAPNNGRWEKINQLGSVELCDHVEIGASSTIDRGAIENTHIGYGVKIDNQVQIAHNVVIGDNTAIASSTAIAGSTKIGSNCTISGCVGIAGHLTITDQVHVTGMSMISHSIPDSGSYSSGMGMEPTSKWRRTVARVRRIDEMAKQFLQLKQQVNKLLEKVDTK